MLKQMYSWAKSCLIMVNNSHYVLLYAFCKYFVTDFCVSAYESYWSLVF